VVLERVREPGLGGRASAHLAAWQCGALVLVLVLQRARVLARARARARVRGRVHCASHAAIAAYSVVALCTRAWTGSTSSSHARRAAVRTTHGCAVCSV
jgi:hypothetical protein